MTAQFIKSRSTPSLGGRSLARDKSLPGGSALMNAPRPWRPRPVVVPISAPEVVGYAVCDDSMREEREVILAVAEAKGDRARRHRELMREREAKAMARPASSIMILAHRDREENGREEVVGRKHRGWV